MQNLTEIDFKSDTLAMQEENRFLPSVCSLIEQTQPQCMQAWLILTASIQLQSSFSLWFFFPYHFADKIAQIWTEPSTAMETEQYSQEINTASPLLVLQPCPQKLEVPAEISAATCKLGHYPIWQGRARWEMPRPSWAASAALPPQRQGASEPWRAMQGRAWAEKSWQKQLALS